MAKEKKLNFIYKKNMKKEKEKIYKSKKVSISANL